MFLGFYNGKYDFNKSSQRAWENIYVLFSQPGESPTLFQPGGRDKNFSQEGRFCLAKKRGVKKKKPMIGRTPAEDESGKFPTKAEAINLEYTSIVFPSSIILYAILCSPGGKCPQNRYHKEQ